jgi:uncharacterized protein
LSPGCWVTDMLSPIATPHWLSSVAGFGVGAAVGMTGIGGGSLMTPLLVLLFGFAPITAVGTDLWFAAVTKVVGGTFHSSKGTVDWQVLRRMSIGSIPACVLTLLWMDQTRMAQLQHGTVIRALGGVLLATAVAVLMRKHVHLLGSRLRTSTAANFVRAQPWLTVLAGVILGVAVPLTSVGAGALGSAMLLYIYPFRMMPSRLAGTDIVHAIPIAAISGLGHLLMGNVDFRLLISLLIGSIPGICLGSLIATKSPAAVLRVAISAILALVSIKLLTT